MITLLTFGHMVQVKQIDFVTASHIPGQREVSHLCTAATNLKSLSTDDISDMSLWCIYISWISTLWDLF